jgi:hypothetical protein
MSFLLAFLKVFAASLVLFAIARLSLPKLVPRFGWLWVLLVGFLALSNMVFHRLLGSTVDSPFCTALLFAIPMGELSRAEPWSQPWPERGVDAIVAGTILGWFSWFFELVARAFP